MPQSHLRDVPAESQANSSVSYTLLRNSYPRGVGTEGGQTYTTRIALEGYGTPFPLLYCPVPTLESLQRPQIRLQDVFS